MPTTDTRDLPSKEALKEVVKTLVQQRLDDVVAVSTERKAEMLARLGEVTQQRDTAVSEMERIRKELENRPTQDAIENLSDDLRRAQNRSVELSNEIDQLKRQIAELEQRPQLELEQVIEELQVPINEMFDQALAKIKE
ncbi:MAG TPA: hypothetical protein VG934_03480 [Candidatus Paceibacterota bacterium]|nr:hypothetical protein [Candidatus Paceibacterota bacterium]